MKMCLLILSLVSFTTSFCQDGFTEKIDKETGIAPFRIDAPRADLEEYLGEEFLPNEPEYEIGVSSSYNVKLSELGVSKFFGLAIREMSVQFDGTTISDSSITNENVFRINLFLERPKDDAELKAYQNALLEFFGDADLMLHPFNMETIVRYQWWSDITLLVVHFGLDEETGKELDFFEVTFYQAYGG